MINKLNDKIKKTGAPIVVGLDPMLSYLPQYLLDEAVAKKGDLKTINTVTSMLSNYDHICIGFRMKK